jgi:hypothetical protein
LSVFFCQERLVYKQSQESGAKSRPLAIFAGLADNYWMLIFLGGKALASSFFGYLKVSCFETQLKPLIKHQKKYQG